ncbi:MAG: UvrD-helicase domain-containing protein [bacterium]|nr:UvrD-helicase domain-containing protein [bacterium]
MGGTSRVVGVDFRAALNEVQYEAVTHGETPLLVVAGAGSGKTRILTYRAAYLAAQGVPPEQILAVTFTNKAADEMARRVHQLVNARVPVSTFHSLCLRMLREQSARIPYRPNFVVYDKSDQLALIKECMRRVHVSEKHAKPRAFANAISRAKDRLLDAAQFGATVKSYLEEAVALVYREYEQALQRANAMDFDDLIMQCVRLLERVPEVAQYYQQRYAHVLVDEFQDTNYAQYVLMKILVAPHRRVSAVGDPDQSIYRFRGAEIRNILDFERDFPEARVITLEQNYRSTATILAAANRVIAHNVERKEKRLWTQNPAGVPVQVYRAADEHDEAREVAARIQALERNGAIRSLRDVVVFYRVHALSRVFEEAFRHARLPYVIVGDVSFYQRREIKDIVAYLRVLVNPADDVNVRRVLNVPPRGIGEATEEMIAECAQARGCCFYAMLEQPEQLPRMTPTLRRRLQEFTGMIARLRAARGEALPTELIRRVLDETNYIAQMCGSDDVQDVARRENIQEFLSAAADYENSCPETVASLEGFLHSIALTAEIDTWNDSADAVTLMTIHNAKGLEFPVVFMAGLEEDLFPHYNSLEDPTDIEEERRLCYVGMTRAQERLILTTAAHRTIFGLRKVREPSRFLRELPAEDVETTYSTQHELISAPEPRARVSRATPGTNGEYTAGMRVMHHVFGPGRIVSVCGSGDAARLTIEFERLPTPKVLVAQYAKLRVVK